MNLCSMTISAINENKLSSTDAIKMITEEVEEDEAIAGRLYEKIYKKAYGNSISKELADYVIRRFAVTDGSERVDGMMWTMDQTNSVGQEIGIDWSIIPRVNFWVVMNMMKSDYSTIAQKLEMEDDPKFFAYMAKDWLMDKDGPDDKLFRYIFKVLM